MPRQGRKVAKSVSTPPQCTPANGSSCQLPQKTTSVDYHVLKRAQLQQQCKKLGIRATGKNAELVERLKAFHKEPLLETGNGEEENTKKNEEQGQKTQGSCIPTATTYRFCTKSGPNSAVAPHESKKGTKKAPPAVTHVDLVNEIKTEPSEEKTDLVRGWCVVHGMILYRPASSWSPLLLRGGMVCVQDGENIVPFHLPPLNISVPDGLSDNYVCQDCVLRNQEKPKRCLLCQQIPRKGSRVSLPKIDLTNVTAPLDSRSRPSLLETSISKDKRSPVSSQELKIGSETYGTCPVLLFRLYVYERNDHGDKNVWSSGMVPLGVVEWMRVSGSNFKIKTNSWWSLSGGLQTRFTF